jgi:surface protein
MHFLATVFSNAHAFNEDLSQWDVAKVTDTSLSKSICILESEST